MGKEESSSRTRQTCDDLVGAISVVRYAGCPVQRKFRGVLCEKGRKGIHRHGANAYNGRGSGHDTSLEAWQGGRRMRSQRGGLIKSLGRRKRVKRGPVGELGVRDGNERVRTAEGNISKYVSGKYVGESNQGTS